MNLLIKSYPASFIFYIASLILCFLVFKQSDLTHTYTSSYAYLNGHFHDFYDYNKLYMERNDYLPLMYVIFAIWNVPLKLLGLLTPANMGIAVWQVSTPLEIMWSKLLLCTFFFGCIVMVGRISELIFPRHRTPGVSPQVLFATSPIAIFAVFIFSQYDVIGVFFTLLGIYFYFQKKFLRFAFFFSVAISFKYFACFIYLPLVLMIEKRPIHILKYGIIGVFITALQIGAYWHSDIFQNSFFALAGNKTGEAMHKGKAIYIVIIYGLLCCYVYFSQFKLTLRDHGWAMSAILVCTFAYGLMFSLVNWHPQWLLILMPFFALVVPFIRHQKMFISLELAGYLAFIWLCVNNWAKNVDVTMAQAGILYEYIPTLIYFGADLLPPKGSSFARIIFYIYLFSPLTFYVCENYVAVRARLRRLTAKASSSDGHLTSVNQNAVIASQTPQLNLKWLYAVRVLVGGYFFLAITFVCLYRSAP